MLVLRSIHMPGHGHMASHTPLHICAKTAYVRAANVCAQLSAHTSAAKTASTYVCSCACYMSESHDHLRSQFYAHGSLCACAHDCARDCVRDRAFALFRKSACAHVCRQLYASISDLGAHPTADLSLQQGIW